MLVADWLEMLVADWLEMLVADWLPPQLVADWLTPGGKSAHAQLASFGVADTLESSRLGCHCVRPARSLHRPPPFQIHLTCFPDAELIPRLKGTLN